MVIPPRFIEDVTSRKHLRKFISSLDLAEFACLSNICTAELKFLLPYELQASAGNRYTDQLSNRLLFMGGKGGHLLWRQREYLFQHSLYIRWSAKSLKVYVMHAPSSRDLWRAASSVAEPARALQLDSELRRDLAEMQLAEE